ncbi:hypothetical protein K469DRAFT_549432 [Zopfia rhizophila CBS 207.26]|uniref:Rhodopsin domain-containing protein n=1 Tax=Zopfia rhizophila CBS 207.26 TaxID=1314779 RepID=A0A6A6EU48_9PEZI|nr:hypothetical protein K469DRAFT_549432 [Zopfia rhizophila CBS 207.26]
MASYKFPSSRVSNGALKETVLVGILEIFAILAVSLRLWARSMKRKQLAFNDYAILVALFFCTSLLAIAITSTVWSGKGFHMHDIDPRYRSRVFVAFTAGQPVWGAANAAVKFSILHLYLTIFQDERFRRVCFGAMAVSMGYFISVFLETFLLCKPVQFNWDKTIPGACNKYAKETYVVAGALNLIIDVFIVILPMPMLFQLRIPRAKKIGLIAMFSLGAVYVV